jgi:CBS domain-containing protein
MRVEQIMNRDVVHCTTKTPVATVAAMMKERNVGLVVVLHEDTRFLAGVITDRDLCLKVLGTNAQPENFFADQCMTIATTYCKSTDSMEMALQKMAEAQVRRLPVVENGMVVGIIGMGDIIRENASPPARIIATLRKVYAPEGSRKKAACGSTSLCRS